MHNPSSRFQRSLVPAAGLAAVLAIAPVAAVAGPSVAAAAVAPAPKVSGLKVLPGKPRATKGFKVQFKTSSGGSYVVFEASSASGGPLVSGTAKRGATVTTKTVGKSLHPIKGLTIGVDLTSGTKTKRETIKITIVK